MALVLGAPPALDYRAAFQKELDACLAKLQQPAAGSSGKRDPKKLAQMKSFAEDFQDGVCRRFAAYTSDSGLNEFTFQPGGGGIDASRGVEDPSQAAKRARLEELRAELGRKSAEEDRLRSEFQEQMKAKSDETWRCGDIELENARKEALASAPQAEELSNASESAGLLKVSLEQFQAQMSEAGSMVDKLEQDAKMLDRIEEQRSRPGLPVEEFFRSTSSGAAFAANLQFFEEGSNSDINQKVTQRWRQEFEQEKL
jgi:hypothetical protein